MNSQAADGKAENDTHYEEIEGEEGVIVDADRTFDEDLELLSYEDFADVDSTDSYEPEVKQKKKRGK